MMELIVRLPYSKPLFVPKAPRASSPASSSCVSRAPRPTHP